MSLRTRVKPVGPVFHRYFANPHYYLDFLNAQAYNLSIMNSLSMTERKQVVAALVEGNSVRSTCRMTGRSKGAVLKMLEELGEACAEYHDRFVRNLKVRRLQADEIWSFVGAK